MGFTSCCRRCLAFLLCPLLLPVALCKRHIFEPVANLGLRVACRYLVLGSFQRCLSRCDCRKGVKDKAKKEKDADDGVDVVELEEGRRPFELSSPMATPNGQDADERRNVRAEGAKEIPAWQMPKLVVANQRRGARIHKNTSVILPDADVGGDLIAGIVSNLPVLLQIKPCWQLGYSMAVDGVSLKTMYRQVADIGPCLLIVEDSANCIFGAFLSEGLKPGSRCYGTHECFLFRYPRSAGAWRTEVYGVLQASQTEVHGAQGDADAQLEGAHWSNYQEALRKCQAWAVASTPSAGVFCDNQGIVIGIDGPALFLDQNLLRGVSWPSRAFGSPCLGANGQPDFVVRNFEVWHWT